MDQLQRVVVILKILPRWRIDAAVPDSILRGGRIPRLRKTIHSVNQSDGGGSVEDRGGAHVFLIPTSGGRFESALVMVFGGANTIHAAGRTTRLGGHAEQPCSSVRCRRYQLSDHMRFHARGAHTGGNERSLPRTIAVPKSRPQ